MTKNKLIEQIKEIINMYGNFNVGEVEGDYSPTVQGQNGNLVHLIESFYQDYGEVNVYSKHSEYPVDNYGINYTELSDSTLSEILELAQKYRLIQLQYE